MTMEHDPKFQGWPAYRGVRIRCHCGSIMFERDHDRKCAWGHTIDRPAEEHDRMKEKLQ